MSVIGIDIGTTSVCALKMDAAGVCGIRRRNHGFLDDVYSQSPEEICAAVLEMADALWDGQVTDIAISSQMHGVLFVNAAGRAITPFYTWKNPWGDTASGESTIAQYLTEQTGRSVRSGYGLCTAFYLNRERTLPTEAVFLCNIGDYVAMRLSGSKEPVMNITIAESIGGFDPAVGDFSREAMARLGLEPRLFPRVSAADVVYGTYRNARVHGAFGDNQCSFLGSVGDYRRDVCINVGTGQQVSCFGETYVSGGETEVRHFFDLGYLYVGVSQNGGKVYERLIRMIESLAALYTGEKIDGYSKTEALWEACLDRRDFPEVVPALYGPVGSQPAGSVLLRGLKDGQDGLDLVAGYVAGMAEELAGLYRRIPEAVRRNKTRFYASGNGIVRNALLWRLTEEKLNAKIERECREEAAAAGAALRILMEET